MIQLFIFTAAVFGLSWGISSSHLSYPFRKALDEAGWTWVLTLAECVGCLGFWIGLSSGLAGLSPGAFNGNHVYTAFYCVTMNLLLSHALGLDKPAL